MGRSLKDARESLESALRLYQTTQRSIKSIYVVYDSKVNISREVDNAGIIKKIFASGVAGNADGEIINLLKGLDHPGRASVLSKDNFVTNHARVMGARITPFENFRKNLTVKTAERKNEKCSDEAKQSINRELKKVWAIE